MSLLLKVIVCVDMDCTVFQDKADVIAMIARRPIWYGTDGEGGRLYNLDNFWRRLALRRRV
jgi:hypothetical protein